MKTTFAAKTFAAKTFASFTIAGGSPAVFYAVTRLGDVATVTVTTSLDDPLWHYWYLDGSYAGRTAGPANSFQLASDGKYRIECVPTDSDDFDPIASAPEGYPSRKTLWWVRSVAADVASYRIEQRIGEGDWTTIAEVVQPANQWEFYLTTDQLADLTDYTWRITPTDAAGNAGTPLTIGPERIVRWPDAPDYDIEFDPKTDKITFS